MKEDILINDDFIAKICQNLKDKFNLSIFDVTHRKCKEFMKFTNELIDKSSVLTILIEKNSIYEIELNFELMESEESNVFKELNLQILDRSNSRCLWKYKNKDVIFNEILKDKCCLMKYDLDNTYKVVTSESDIIEIINKLIKLFTDFRISKNSELDLEFKENFEEFYIGEEN